VMVRALVAYAHPATAINRLSELNNGDGACACRLRTPGDRNQSPQ